MTSAVKLAGIGLTILTMLIVLNATTTQQRFAKYRKIEAYEIRPGILIMPKYSAEGQVCEIGLEKMHYSGEKISLDSGLQRNEIDEIFDELAPTDERGPRAKDFESDLITQDGPSLVTIMIFEKVSIQIYGNASPAAGKGPITVNEVAATLKWKQRVCR